MKKMLFTLTLLLGMASISFAQIDTPAASPSCKIEQKVGLTDVIIEYSRPSMKERTIFAEDGLVAYGELWRTGANAATKITFSDDVTLGKQEVAAGSYALLTMPSASTWAVHLYKYEEGSWSSYKEKTPDVELAAKSSKLGHQVETFTISIDNLRDDSATLQLMWDKTMVSIPMGVESDSRVLEAIKTTMAGPSKGEYYTAASYYFNKGKDLEQALAWIQKANDTDNQKFWQLRRESQILGELGKYKDAIAIAEKSMKLAEMAGNKEYVKFNTEAIAKWTGMLKK